MAVKVREDRGVPQGGESGFDPGTSVVQGRCIVRFGEVGSVGDAHGAQTEQTREGLFHGFTEGCVGFEGPSKRLVRESNAPQSSGITWIFDLSAIFNHGMTIHG